MKTFKLLANFNENGIFIKKGHYTYNQLVRFFGDEGKFNFCFNCTSLKEILKEIIETPEQSEEIESQENDNVETPEDNLNIETKIPKIKKKSGK